MAELSFGIAAQTCHYLSEITVCEDVWLAKLISHMSKRCSIPHQM